MGPGVDQSLAPTDLKDQTILVQGRLIGAR
jgi:hypothetical protein